MPSSSSFTNSSSTTSSSFTPGTLSYAFLELVELTLGFNPLIIKRNEYKKSTSASSQHPSTTTSSSSSVLHLSSTHTRNNYKLPQLSAQEKLKKVSRSELHATIDNVIDNGTLLVSTAVCSYDEDKIIMTQELNTFDRLLAIKKKYSHIPFERGLTWSRDAVRILEQLRSLLPGESNPYEGQYKFFLQQFTHLALIGMDITTIDKGVQYFTNLTDLNISQNKDMRILHLRNLPRSLHGLTAIGNGIREITYPDQIHYSHPLSTSAAFNDTSFSSLWSLSLGSNYLSHVPYNLHILFPHLQVLDISGNELTDLPLFLNTLNHCTELTHLVTYKNPIALTSNYIFHMLDKLPKLQSFDDRPLNNDLRAWISTMVNKLRTESTTTISLMDKHTVDIDYTFQRVQGLPVPSQVLGLFHLSKSFNLSFVLNPSANENGTPSPVVLPQCSYRVEVALTSDVNLVSDTAKLGVPPDRTTNQHTAPAPAPAPATKPGTAVPSGKANTAKTVSRPASASKDHGTSNDTRVPTEQGPIDLSLTDNAFATIQFPAIKHSLSLAPTVELCRNIRFAHLSINVIETSSSPSPSESPSESTDATTDTYNTKERIIATGKVMLSGLTEPTDKASLTVDLSSIPLSIENLPSPLVTLIDSIGNAISNPSVYPVTVQNELSNCDILWNNDKRKQILRELSSTNKVQLEYGTVTIHLHKFS